MIEFTINDMTCGGCVASITRVVKGLDPAATVDANVGTRHVRIDTLTDTGAMLAAISAAGYHPQIAA